MTRSRCSLIGLLARVVLGERRLDPYVVEGAAQHRPLPLVRAAAAAHMGHEVLRDLLVAAALEASRVRGERVLGGPVRLEDEAQRVREAGGDSGHRVVGADRVGERRLDPSALVTLKGGIFEQVVEPAPDAGERARDRAVDPLGGD